MFDRAAASLIATAAACAATALAIFAAGFALYALLAAPLGPAGAAAAVAGVAALGVGVFALVAHHRAKTKAREAELAQAELMQALPGSLAGFTNDHPLLALGVTLLGGVIATRHPRLSRDIVSILARFTGP